MGKANGYIGVEFNGEEKLLRFDFNAIADIEEYYGKGISAIMSDERIGFSTVRAMYWGGLKWKMKGLTIPQAGQMIQKKMDDEEVSFKELMEPVVKAMQASGILGSKKDNEEEDDGDEHPKN